MNKTLSLAGLVIALLPCATLAAPVKSHAPKTSHKAPATQMYICAKCHMKVTAAAARKDHYKDPMDGGALVPVDYAAGTRKPAAR